MPDRNLTQLQKIGGLRLRRSERELKAARSALSEAEAARTQAEESLQDQTAQMHKAKQESYANPALEQAWIWQNVSERKRQNAAVHHDNMCSVEQKCEEGLKQAGQALLKSQVKQDGFATVIRQHNKAEERKTEDALAEERQDSLHHRPRMI
ncbi:hypothetical protein GCM10009096_23360 [Parasphingorhabdus litoris]|uniref:Flagellar FliJ protein n=1 Tax=Parasphingorhabdus litoris TaxID=394733 RepID=A0ABN1ANH2_9SPHN|nr:hypothetical protein [Parasphingorhabdus litoris]